MTWTLITGAAKGLGKEIAKTLAKKGYAVVIHYNNSSPDDLIEECRSFGAKAQAIQGDFSSQDSIDEFLRRYLEQFPKTQHLINNVGNYFMGSWMDTPIEIYRDLYQTNFLAPVALINALLPSIKALQGTITNIGVVGLNDVPADIHKPAYIATKLALWLATKGLARELISSRVRVNMVSPGYMENAVDLPDDLATIPWGRPGTLKEVADVVAFFMETGYITGQNIEVAGGLHL